MIPLFFGVLCRLRCCRYQQLFWNNEFVTAHSVETMRVAAAIALMAGSAAAFAPANTGRVSTAVAGAFDSEIGATDFGDRTVCWDPLNFVENGDQARFDRLRSVEIKHGRVAMLATLGYASTYGNEYRFPGCENFPGGHAAVIGDSAINTIDLVLPILAICGALELGVFKQKEGSFPGDLSAGGVPVGFGPYARDEADMIDLRTKELLNGRAAQMGILGMMVHEQLDGKPFIFFEKFTPYFLGPVAI